MSEFLISFLNHKKEKKRTKRVREDLLIAFEISPESLLQSEHEIK